MMCGRSLVSLLLSDVQVCSKKPTVMCSTSSGMKWKLLGRNLKQDVEKRPARERAAEDGRRRNYAGGWRQLRLERTKKMKITHLEQSLLNYSTHILSPLGYVGVELVQIGGER